MEQAGVENIKLYENKGVSIIYNASGKITSISNTGDTIELDSVNDPKFKFNTNPSDNNDLIFDYILTGYLYDMDIDTFDKLEMLYESAYGWIPEIELQNTEKILINDPFFGEAEKLETNISHDYFLEIKPRQMSDKQPLYFE